MQKVIHDQETIVACPACSGRSFESLIDFGMVPRSGSFLSGTNQPYQMTRLSFEFCSRCALIRRRWFEENIGDYSNVNRTTSHHLPDYVTQIVKSLRERSIGPDELIVEVGANDGAFLDVLSQAGFTNRLGIEPSLACVVACSAKGHRVENVHLDQSEAVRIREQYGPAMVVVCRHTLEHVPDPLDLLLAMRYLLCEGGILFVEVPDSRGIIYDLRGHELWDEHLHSFTPENLLLLMHRAGLGANKTLVLPYRGTVNILLWSSLRSAENGAPDSFLAYSSNVQASRRFGSRWVSLCEQLRADVAEWPRPIACLGASHPQSNLLLFTDLGRHVAFLVDDDPAKIGHNVPVPQPVPVISTVQLLDGELPGTVIRAAFGYEEWMDRLLSPLALAGVRLVSPSHY